MEDSGGWLREKSFMMSKSDVSSISVPVTTTFVPASPRLTGSDRDCDTPLKNHEGGSNHQHYDHTTQFQFPPSSEQRASTQQHQQRGASTQQHLQPYSIRKMEIVFGLEGTLVHSEHHSTSTASSGVSAAFQGAFIVVKRNDKTEDDHISVKYRPHLAHFLATVIKYFDIAIFSSGEQDYVDALLDVMDPSGQVFPKPRRYYRQHCTSVMSDDDPLNMEKISKDLQILGRPLNEVVLVDDTASSGALQPNNLILIPTWTGDPSDTALLQLATNLAHNAEAKPRTTQAGGVST